MTIKTDDLTELDNRALGDRAEQAIIAAAIMSATPSYQDAVDAIYDECARRNKGIYQRAWNRAARSQGHESITRPVIEGA